MRPSLYHRLFKTPYHFLIFGQQTIPRFTFNTVQTLAFGHLFFTNFYSVGSAGGDSMLPTLQTHSLVLNSRLHARGKGVRTGDMVIAVAPYDPERWVLKRVIGREGDFVLVDPRGNEMVQVPKGHVWLAGDNLDYSRDSRHYGPVPVGLIKGKVVARIWPSPKWFENGLVDAYAAWE